MLDTALLACPGCTAGSPVVFVAGLYVGGVITLYSLMHPYAKRMGHLWGLPRYRFTDLVSLLMLLIWPVLLGRLAAMHHSLDRVILCTLGLIACACFLWLRGLWILQELQVTSFAARTTFLGILVPGIIVIGVIVGYGLVSSLAMVTYWGPIAVIFALGQLMICLAVALPLAALAAWALSKMLQQSATPPTPANHPG